MLEHSLGCDPWVQSSAPTHLAMMSDSTRNVGRCKSVDDFFIDSLNAYASSRSLRS